MKLRFGRLSFPICGPLAWLRLQSAGYSLLGKVYSLSEGLPFRVSEKVLLGLVRPAIPARYTAQKLSYPNSRAGLHIASEKIVKDLMILCCGATLTLFISCRRYIPWPNRENFLASCSGTPDARHFLFKRRPQSAAVNSIRTIARWIETQPIKLALLGGRWRNHRKQIQQFLTLEDPATNPGGLAPTLTFLNSRNITVSILAPIS